jgi:hypothetical protein
LAVASSEFICIWRTMPRSAYSYSFLVSIHMIMIWHYCQ